MEVKMVVFVMLAQLSSLILESTSFKLVIVPTMYLLEDGTNYHITCSTSVPYEQCEIWIVKLLNYPPKYPLDYFKDRSSPVSNGETEFDRSVNMGGTRCHRKGTVSSDHNTTINAFISLCRARTLGGGWQYTHQVMRVLDWGGRPYPPWGSTYSGRPHQTPSTTRRWWKGRDLNANQENIESNIKSTPSMNAEPGNVTRENLDLTTMGTPPMKTELGNVGTENATDSIVRPYTKKYAPRQWFSYLLAPINTGPIFVYGEAGKGLKIEYSSTQNFVQCHFMIRASSELSTFNNQTAPKGVHYDHGENQKKCGVTFDKLESRFSDFVVVKARTSGVYLWATAVIVITAPKKPVLTLNAPRGIYNRSDTLSACCTTGKSRPVVKMWWLLGNDVIRNDLYNDDVSGNDRKYVTQLIEFSQKISIQLKNSDNGKDLICKAEHIAWKEPAEAKQTVIVNSRQDTDSDYILYLSYFLAGLAAVSTAAALTMAFILCCTYCAKIWCFDPSCASD